MFGVTVSGNNKDGEKRNEVEQESEERNKLVEQ